MDPKYINPIATVVFILGIVAVVFLLSNATPAQKPVNLSNGEGRSCQPL